jgi:hypothetical protein
MIHDINLISIKFAILNNTLYMNTYDTVIIVTMHGMELFSERTGILIANRLALLHFFLRSIMLHSNKGTCTCVCVVSIMYLCVWSLDHDLVCMGSRLAKSSMLKY